MDRSIVVHRIEFESCHEGKNRDTRKFSFNEK